MGQTLLGRAAFDRLGRSLDLSADGHRLAAGATQFKGEGPGYVQVYDFNGTGWTQIGQDVYGDVDQDVFGRDVALSADGSILACGANLASNPNGDEDAGLARAYRLTEEDGDYVWTQMGESIFGTFAGDGLGLTVALSADGFRLIVGASQKKNGVGYVRVLDYDEANDSWVPLGQELVGENIPDKFGSDVQISSDGNRLAVGVIASDGNGDDAGQVQVYNIAELE